MKHRLIAAIIMLIFCVGTAVLSSYTLNKTCDKLLDSLNLCLEAAERDDADTAKRFADEAEKQMDDSQKLYLFLLNCSDIDVLEEQINELAFFTGAANLEQAGRAACVCIGELEHLKESLKLSLENIF